MYNPFSKLKEFWKMSVDHSDGRRDYAVYIFLDLMYCRVRYGAYPDSYFFYQFHRFNRFVASDFLLFRSQSKFWEKFNSQEAHRLFADKYLFNERFKEFINRKYRLVKDSADLREVMRWPEREVIVKPADGMCGRGIFLLDTADRTKMAELNALLGRERFLVEQIVRNAAALRRLNPYSLNTVRVITCIDRSGKVHVISAALRMGSNISCVDNAHSGGIACAVNIEHGIVDSYAGDLEGRKFIVHPLTGEKIIGLQIPHWDKMHAYLERLTRVVPDARYVGWDIAVTDEGFELIEGNTRLDHVLMQGMHLVGCYRQIRSLL